MGGLLQDLRFGLRMLVRWPGFTIMAVLSIGLGIGANTAIFSVVDGVLLRPLPYDDPDELVVLWGIETGMRSGSNWASYPDFVDFEAQALSFESLAAWSSQTLTLTGYGGEPVRIPVTRVTWDLFSELGVSPAAGRSILPEEDRPGGANVLVLTHAFWRDRLGSPGDVVGRTLTLDGHPFEIVGVMPEGFQWSTGEVYAPLVPVYGGDSRGMHRIIPLGRLAAGVSREEAESEVVAIASRLETQYPEWNSNRSARLEAYRDTLVGSVGTTLWAVFGMVGLVLLIACANVANLMLTRATERTGEVAVRSALGAGRRQIARQLIVESLVLSLLGGVAGVAVAAGGLGLLVRLAPAGLPRMDEIGLSPVVLGFALVLTLVTGAVFGLLPTLQAARRDVYRGLKAGGRTRLQGSRGWLSKAVVVGQVALAMVAVVSAGLLVNSFIHLQRVDPGFRPSDDVLVVPISLPEGKYWGGEDPDGARSVAFYREAERRIEALPGVTRVASAYMHPLAGGWESSFVIKGVLEPPQGEQPEARLRPVTPGYFQTVGMRLLEGRDISDDDTGDAPGVVVVNESFRRTFVPNGDALGHVVARSSWWADLPYEYEIVGVVADVRMDGLTADVPTALYFSYPQFPFAEMNLVVETEVAARSIQGAIEHEIHEIDPQLPVENVHTLAELRADTVGPERFRTILVSLFAGLALALSAIGIYGVLSYSVARRTREMGLRMSLGARTGDVLRLVIRQGMTLTLVGVAIGIALSALATGLLSSLLFEVSPTDPATFAGVSLVLSLVALLACLVPAWRATRADPVIALRTE